MNHKWQRRDKKKHRRKNSMRIGSRSVFTILREKGKRCQK